MKPETKPKGLHVHFLPMPACPKNFRVITAIRTPNETVHGFVYQHDENRNLWSNSREPDNFRFKSRMEAGRNLVERPGLYEA